MILLCGIPTEAPLALVRGALEELDIPFLTFNQRAFRETSLGFNITGGRVSGVLRMGECEHSLEDIEGVYVRLMNDQLLPEMQRERPDSPARRYCRSLHEALSQWCEIAPARVVNRSGPMASNFSKPYQMQLIRGCGFSIPETLITNDPELVRDFLGRHGKVIYKSVSGVRSVVQLLREEDLPRLESSRWCPIQFQAFVPGFNVRVHVVHRAVFATRIETQAVDYRYSNRQAGADAELRPFELPDDTGQKCVDLAAALKLPFAGVDLKITPDGEVFCFEVNPSPAFSYYESHTSQPIAMAVARYLAGGS